MVKSYFSIGKKGGKDYGMVVERGVRGIYLPISLRKVRHGEDVLHGGDLGRRRKASTGEEKRFTREKRTPSTRGW